MDFIRATIKGLFYDIPINAIGPMICGDKSVTIINCLEEVLKWKERFFTMSEIKILTDIVTKNWMLCDMRGRKFHAEEKNRIFLPLNQFSKDVIDDSDEEPRIKFSNLLRWHELAMYIGEDLLVTAYLAERDAYCRRERISFVWPDVLHHDNHQLNHILDSGLCDVHAHLGATTDVFGINWISIMNNPTTNKWKNEAYQDFDILLHDNLNTMPLRQWGWLAAVIRENIYQLTNNGQHLDHNQLCELWRDYNRGIYDLVDTYAQINAHKEEAYKMPNGDCFDYAITTPHVSELSNEELSSPYMIHSGERYLLYKFFYMYFCRDAKAISAAPWMYLYLLIKIKFRREFIETNPLLGLSNFQSYEHRKKWFINNNDVMYKYAVQTSIGDRKKNFLEARVCADVVDKIRFTKTAAQMDNNPKLSVFDCIFNNSCYLSTSENNHLSFVIHFIKQPNDKKSEQEGMLRHSELRQNINKDMTKILTAVKKNKTANDKGLPLLYGIDAAGNELSCRPEVFAPYFRWAKAEGLRFFTYHAGEDFYDLVDGIRAIDELMLFMEYSHGCRIGHALALGINAFKYYSNRHNNVIMPKQVLLDNLVWMIHKSRILNHRLQPSTEEFCQRTIHQLFIEIGYRNTTNEYNYWQSMLLRGDKSDFMCDEDESYNTMSRLTALCPKQECIEARMNEEAKKLHQIYETSKKIKKEGSKPCAYQLPKTFHKDVTVLQEAILCDIEHKGICIECNPTSNLQIGPFDKYDELPILRFMSVGNDGKGHSIQISINTDDRGIFATSLQNEYSLIAASMHKQMDEQSHPKYSADEINQYIKRIIDHSQNMRFQ